MKIKKILVLLMVSFICNSSFSQNSVEAEKLVDEGVANHDKGDYEGAIALYDKALQLDKDNLFALTEKAFSLLALKKYDEVISYCQKAISTHAGDKLLKTVYVTYGNALDGQKKADKSLEIYDEGIKLFPQFYLLYYNKGITLAGLKKYDEAILCFQKAVTYNPRHASSHNAIARLSNANSKRIPALMAYCRFLALEPQSNRAKENLASLQELMTANVKETGKKSVTINLSPDMLSEPESSGKTKENNFAALDLLLSMDAALDFEKKNKKKSDLEKFIRKFETFAGGLSETKGDNYGFFWDYYAPYFIEMKNKQFIETFAYIAFASSDDPSIGKWLKEHKSETDRFFEWSKAF